MMIKFWRELDLPSFVMLTWFLLFAIFLWAVVLVGRFQDRCWKDEPCRDRMVKEAVERHFKERRNLSSPDAHATDGKGE